MLCFRPGLWYEVEPVALLTVPPAANSLSLPLPLPHLNEENSRPAERREKEEQEEETAVCLEDHHTLTDKQLSARCAVKKYNI